MQKSQMEMYGRWLLIGAAGLFVVDLTGVANTGGYAKLAAVGGLGLIGLGMVM